MDQDVAGAGAALSAVDCPAGYNIIQGTNGANTLIGTAGSDCILGLGGSDTIYGMGGDDFLVGGNGSDTLYGGEGDDTLYGEDKADTLHGEAGNDTLYGGTGPDDLFGGDGNDVAYGEAGGDTIEGGLGDDRLYGGAGRDIMRGGAGVDRIFGEGEADDLYGDEGDDILDGGPSSDDIWGGAGHDVIQGAANGDNLRGDDGNDAILGGPGANIIDGGNGIDRCTGTSCELPVLIATGCTVDDQCAAAQACIVELGLCLPCLADQDGDGSCDGIDGCPIDPEKTAPGLCGCGVEEADSDSDGVCDATDVCPGSDDAIDTDGDGVPDGCDGCFSDAECEDENECTVATCIDRVCTYPAVPRGSGVTIVTNGDFELAQLGAFTAYQTAAGRMVGPSFIDARMDSDTGPVSRVLQLMVGRASGVTTGSEGGGVYQVVTLNDGDLTVSVQVATVATVAASGTSDGGTYAVFVDGTAVATESIGTISRGQMHRRTLTAVVPSVERGPHEIRVEATRAGQVANGVLSLFDNIVISGLATQQPAECAGGAGVCDDSGACTPCVDADGDGTCNDLDGCASDTGKTAPGACGCGVADTDSDGDGTADCVDACPGDPNKLEPLICGCGVADTDTDGDQTRDCLDRCPNDPTRTSDIDSDGDGTIDCNDECAGDPNKIAAGTCGCNFAETDPDGDGIITCVDDCLEDPTKTVPGICGCGVADTDRDYDGVADCIDGCPDTPDKSEPGICGCDMLDADSDADGTLDCHDICEGWDDALDQDQDGIPDGCDIGCVAGASGPFIHEGDVVIASAADIALLEGLTCITGHLEVAYTSLQDLRGLEALEEVVGIVAIYGNSALTSLAGLNNLRQAGGLDLSSNAQLSNVAELSGLTSLSDWLVIADNGALANLAGLGNLEAFPASGEANLFIADNPNLPPCWIWLMEEQLEADCGFHDADYPVLCHGNRGSGSCGALPPDFVCAPGATGPGVYDGDIEIWGPNAAAQLADFNGALCITGNVVLWGTDLAGLDALAALQAVGGFLWIAENSQLAAIELPALTSIGAELSIYGNSELVSLTGLMSLASVNSGNGAGAVIISDNVRLPPCWAWWIAGRLGASCNDEWSCDGNRGEGSCGELPPDVVCEPGAVGPGVYDGDIVIAGASALNQLANVAGAQCITGDIWIESYEITALDELEALRAVGGDLIIQLNDNLAELGLFALTEVGGRLTIRGNGALTELAALASLTSVGEGGLVIGNNHNLPPCWVWQLEAQTGENCGGYLPDEYQCFGNQGAGSCGELPADFACEPGATGPGVYQGDVSLQYAADTAALLASLHGARCITGSLEIQSPELIDLDALFDLQGIGGSLAVRFSGQLTGIELPALTTIGGSLTIEGNGALVELSGLANLRSIGAEGPNALFIGNNPQLAPCWMWLIEGQTGVDCGDSGAEVPPNYTCVGNLGEGGCGELPPDFVCERGATGPGVYHGDVVIHWYTGNAIESFAGVRCITGDLQLIGSRQSDHGAFASLEAIGDDLLIYGSQELTDIELPALWSVGGTLNIQYNEALTSLAGLGSLEVIGSGRPKDGLVIRDNALLPECWVDAVELQTETTCGRVFDVPDYASCANNNGSGTCGGAGLIDCGPGTTGPGVYEGDVYVSGAAAGAALAILDGIECVTGTLSITESTLTDLAPLGSLIAIGGDLEIASNEALENLRGLDRLRQLGGNLIIDSNAVLPPCWVFELEARTDATCGDEVSGQWLTCDGNGGAGSCQAPLPTYCYPGATGPGIFDGYVEIWGDSSNVAAEDLEGVHCITGSVVILDSPLTNLDMFASVEAIGGSLMLGWNAQLTAVDGLRGLESVGAGLSIAENPVLADLDGLTRLRWNGSPSPGSGLTVNDNNSLPACWVSILWEQLWLTQPSYGAGYGNNGSGSCE